MSAAPHLHVVRDIDTNGEITNCPHCSSAYAEADQWKQDVLTLKRQLKQALEDKDAKMRADKDFPAAIGLIQEWKAECGHPNASEDDPKRVRLALSVVKRYKKQREKLSLVIQQAKHLAFVDPDTGFKFDEFGRIFGGSDEIEARATKWYLHCRRRGLDPRTGAKA